MKEVTKYMLVDMGMSMWLNMTEMPLCMMVVNMKEMTWYMRSLKMNMMLKMAVGMLGLNMMGTWGTV